MKEIRDPRKTDIPINRIIPPIYIGLRLIENGPVITKDEGIS